MSKYQSGMYEYMPTLSEGAPAALPTVDPLLEKLEKMRAIVTDSIGQLRDIPIPRECDLSKSISLLNCIAADVISLINILETRRVE